MKSKRKKYAKRNKVERKLLAGSWSRQAHIGFKKDYIDKKNFKKEVKNLGA